MMPSNDQIQARYFPPTMRLKSDHTVSVFQKFRFEGASVFNLLVRQLQERQGDMCGPLTPRNAIVLGLNTFLSLQKVI